MASSRPPSYMEAPIAIDIAPPPPAYGQKNNKTITKSNATQFTSNNTTNPQPKARQQQQQQQRPAAPTKRRTSWQYTVFYCTCIVLFFTAYYLLIVYAHLPKTVATHSNGKACNIYYDKCPKTTSTSNTTTPTSEGSRSTGLGNAMNLMTTAGMQTRGEVPWTTFATRTREVVLAGETGNREVKMSVPGLVVAG